MNSYALEANRYDLSVGQILILWDDFTNRESFSNLINTVDALISAKVLPILNENDPVKTEDLTLGDNDILSAMVAVAFSADKLIILTNQDGLYSGNPDTDPKAKLIKNVLDVDFEIERLCTKDKSELGSGGMLSKVRAAKHAVSSGIEVLFGNGLKNGIILSAFEKDFSGTKFVSRAKPPVGETKRWMMSAKGVGLLTVDDGAVKALNSGKSLLLPGIVSAKGDFDKGEIVEIASKAGAVVAYGKVNYPVGEIQRALALKKQLKEKGQRILDKEIIHRDYMVILSNN